MLDMFNPTNANLAAFGGQGVRVLNAGQSLPAGEIAFAIIALGDSSFTANLNNAKGDAALSVNLLTGLMIFTEMVDVSVSAGTILAYLK